MSEKITVCRMVLENILEIDKVELLNIIEDAIKKIEVKYENEYNESIDKMLSYLQEVNDKRWIFKRKITREEAENACNKMNLLDRFNKKLKETEMNPYLKLKLEIMDNNTVLLEQFENLGIEIKKP